MSGDERSSQDRPDSIDIGPARDIPIIDADDPRFVEERAAWSLATRRAQAMLSADDLLTGLRDPEWRVRFEVVDRLAARARTDPRTEPALLEAFHADESDAVRSQVAARLVEFESPATSAALAGAIDDADEDVRWWARYALGLLDESELGLDDGNV